MICTKWWWSRSRITNSTNIDPWKMTFIHPWIHQSGATYKNCFQEANSKNWQFLAKNLRTKYFPPYFGTSRQPLPLTYEKYPTIDINGLRAEIIFTHWKYFSKNGKNEQKQQKSAKTITNWRYLYLRIVTPTLQLGIGWAHEELCMVTLIKGQTKVFQILVRWPVTDSLNNKRITVHLKQQHCPTPSHWVATI